MERLKRLVLQGEDDLVRRMFEYACSRGYGQRMPSLEEAYRVEVGTLTANLVQALELETDIHPPSASVDLRHDPVAAVGARLVRVRGADSADAALLVGLLKCYRHAYLDLLSSYDGFVGREKHDAIRAIGRYFDRVELGVVLARTGADPQAAGSTADKRGSIVDERNRYLAAFSSLPIPALFIDRDGHVEHINGAASVLFGSNDSNRARYFQDPSERHPAPVLAREIADFRDAAETEVSFERELRTAKGTRYFQVRLTKTPGADGEYSGVLAVLSDLTHRRNAEEALRQSQNQYASLFANMPFAFAHTRVLLDRGNRAADHTLLEVNPAFEQLCGCGASALVGRPLTEVLRRVGASEREWMETVGRTALLGEMASFRTRLAEPDAWVSVMVFSPTPGRVALILRPDSGDDSADVAPAPVTAV